MYSSYSTISIVAAKYYTPSGRCIQSVRYTGGRNTEVSKDATSPGSKDATSPGSTGATSPGSKDARNGAYDIPTDGRS